MDYKVQRIYSLMLVRYKKLTALKDAEEALEALIDFKQRYPGLKCAYWVPK